MKDVEKTVPNQPAFCSIHSLLEGEPSTDGSSELECGVSPVEELNYVAKCLLPSIVYINIDQSLPKCNMSGREGITGKIRKFL